MGTNFDQPLNADRRKAVIEAATAKSDGKMTVPFRGSFRTVSVALLPITLPLYRANNGRLAVLQGEYLHRKGLNADYFESGEETGPVQRVLHDFLSKLSEHPEGPIKQALARTARLVEPILITSDGLVVNGNRRLAAMRDLLNQNSDKYSNFSEIPCGVLPSETTASDLEMIEAALQLAPETKLAYGWVERRLKIRRQRDVLGLSTAEIIETYQLFDADQLNNELEELALAERYLRDFLEERDYSLVLDLEEAFRQLNDALAKVRDLPRKVWEEVGFCLISASQRNPDFRPLRVYPFVPPDPAYAPNVVLHRLGAELDLWRPRDMSESFKLPSASELLVLRSKLKETVHADRHAELILSLFEAVTTEHREQPSPDLLIRNLENVARLATRIESSGLSAAQRRKLNSLLARIVSLTDRQLEESRSKAVGLSGFRKFFSRFVKALRRKP